jgi:hypothetical protein
MKPIVKDYFEVCPSEDGEAITNLPEPRVLINTARQLRKNPGEAAPVLACFTEATSVSVLYGGRAVPSPVWLDLTDAITSTAYSMTVSDISELLKLLATALHRCGRRLNPHATSLSALADGARAAFKSREHSTEELLEFQSAVADVLRVVALGGGAGTRSLERREWGQALATKLLPLLAVGTAAVYATYKTISAEFDGEDSEHAVQNALFFAEALTTTAWCPTTTVPIEKLEAGSSSSSSTSNKGRSKKDKNSSSTGAGWKSFFCFMPSATNTVSPATITTTNTTNTDMTPTTTTTTTTLSSSLPSYPQLLTKITSRSATIAQWLEETLASAALNSMTLHQLDTFTAALVTAAGDDGTTLNNNNKISTTTTTKYNDVDTARESGSYGSKKSSLIKDILVRCAGDAIEEAATRVINAGCGGGGGSGSSVSGCCGGGSSTCGYSTTTSTVSGSSNGDSSPPTTPAYSSSTPNSHRINSEFTFSTHSPPRTNQTTTTTFTTASTTTDEVDVCSARRMAATARRNWEAAASVHSPKAADVANFASILENYVAAREDEEDAAVQAEIAAAAARLELESL